jgi:hypothetical protein
MKKLLLLACVVWAVMGCSAHSPMIVKTTTNVGPIISKGYDPHSNPVLLLEGPLPADMEYVVIATIDVGKVWYTGADGIMVEMARRARSLGADAVIHIKRWRQPSGFAWAAPHGQGQAVKIIKKDNDPDLSKLGPVL